MPLWWHPGTDCDLLVGYKGQQMPLLPASCSQEHRTSTQPSLIGSGKALFVQCKLHRVRSETFWSSEPVLLGVCINATHYHVRMQENQPSTHAITESACLAMTADQAFTPCNAMPWHICGVPTNFHGQKPVALGPNNKRCMSTIASVPANCTRQNQH